MGSKQSGPVPATAWALASGSWAGHSATLFACRYGAAAATRNVVGVGTAGLRPTEGFREGLDTRTLITGVQQEVMPVAKFYRRDGAVMQASLDKLNGLWDAVRAGLAGDSRLRGADYARSVTRARDTAALIAAGRWIFASALERKESRGLHRRSDYPVLVESQHSHVITGGLDQVWVKRKPVEHSYLQVKAS